MINSFRGPVFWNTVYSFNIISLFKIDSSFILHVDCINYTLVKRCSPIVPLCFTRAKKWKHCQLFKTVSDPDVPTLVEVTNVHQTSATLEWNDGNTAVINSSRVFYVDTSSMSSWQTTNTINHLTGLTPERTYLFYLRVTSFDKMAESLNHTVITRKFVVSCKETAS